MARSAFPLKIGVGRTPIGGNDEIPVLAYWDEKDWNALTRSEQDALLAQDEVLRRRGDLVA